MAVVYAETSLTHTNAGGNDTVAGQREDLIDIIYNISPTETPFMMMAGRGTARATYHEWQMDILDAAAANAEVEGADVSTTIDEAVATIRVGNHLQISDKKVSVSGTSETINKAGRSSELSYQLAKRAKELKRDMEFSMVGQSVASVARASATAGVSASLQSFFHADWYQGGPGLDGTHISRETVGGGPPGADGGWDALTNLWDAATDSGTQRALLESDVQGVIQGAWTNGGDPSVIMCGPFNKRVISGFTGNSTRFDRGEDKRLVAAVDVYVSDFGEHRVVPNRFQRERDLFVLTPELIKVNYLRPFRQFPVAKLGDAETRVLLAEWTLAVGNQAGLGLVADLTTS